MRSQRHGGGDSHEHGIDLAPMLDFVLNLLIFFVGLVAMVFAAIPIAFAFGLATFAYIVLTTSTPETVVIGRMDEVALYDRPLTIEEIRAHHRLGSAGPRPERSRSRRRSHARRAAGRPR